MAGFRRCGGCYSSIDVVWAIKKDAKWFRFISLSLTALTVCAEYSLVEKWVLKEDLSALTDRINDREIFMKGIDNSYLYEGYYAYLIDEL